MKKEITNVELEIMKVIWNDGSVSMNELIEKLNKNKSTTKTHIYRLLEKKILTVDRERNPFRYMYTIKKEDFIIEKTRELIDNFFEGNKENMIKMIEKM